MPSTAGLVDRARPKTLKNIVRPLGLKQAPASSELLRRFTASSNASPPGISPITRLTGSIPGASGCRSGHARRVVLAHDQAAARRDRQVVRRVQRGAGRRLVDERERAVAAAAGPVGPDLAEALGKPAVRSPFLTSPPPVETK